MLTQPSRLVRAATPVVAAITSALSAQTIDWDGIGWNQNAAIGPEQTPYFDPVDHVKNPYTGLGSNTGGLSGFLSQSFSDVAGSGVDLSVYYSRNNYDGSTLEGPDLYSPSGGSSPNPDRRTTGDSALRITRDNTLNGGILHPVTVVFSFNQPVLFEEFIIGSLSTVGSSRENVVLRAFSAPDATGVVVKASGLRNISALSDGSTLLHSQWDPTGPTTNNDLFNIAIDPDITMDANGEGTNVGSNDDDGIYHVIGVGNQADSRYGRVAFEWDAPVQSVAASFYPSDSTDFDNYNPTTQWVSAIASPFTFTPVPEPAAAALLAGGLLSSLRRRRH